MTKDISEKTNHDKEKRKEHRSKRNLEKIQFLSLPIIFPTPFGPCCFDTLLLLQVIFF